MDSVRLQTRHWPMVTQVGTNSLQNTRIIQNGTRAFKPGIPSMDTEGVPLALEFLLEFGFFFGSYNKYCIKFRKIKISIPLTLS